MTRNQARSRLGISRADLEAHVSFLSRLVEFTEENAGVSELLTFGSLSLQTIVIYDGIPTGHGEFPEVCALYARGGLIGTGVVLTSTRVLTAGHVADFGIIDAVFPLNNVNTAPNNTAHHDVTHTARNPDADLAVLTIENSSPLDFATARLGDIEAFNSAKTSGVVMVGFGNFNSDEGQSTYGVKRKSGVLGIVGNGSAPSVGIPAAIQVGANPQAVCTKDSGGPLYLANTAPPVVVGIALERPNTIGPVCGRDSIFLRTDVYRPWITQQL